MDSGEGQLLLDKDQKWKNVPFPHNSNNKENYVEILKQENKILRYELEQLKNAMYKHKKKFRLTEKSKQNTTIYSEQEYHTTRKN